MWLWHDVIHSQLYTIPLFPVVGLQMLYVGCWSRSDMWSICKILNTSFVDNDYYSFHTIFKWFLWRVFFAWNPSCIVCWNKNLALEGSLSGGKKKLVLSKLSLWGKSGQYNFYIFPPDILIFMTIRQWEVHFVRLAQLWYLLRFKQNSVTS